MVKIDLEPPYTTEYFVHEQNYDVIYSKYTWGEPVRSRKQYGPYLSREIAEQEQERMIQEILSVAGKRGATPEYRDNIDYGGDRGTRFFIEEKKRNVHLEEIVAESKTNAISLEKMALELLMRSFE
jgi:hypothetical protein